MIYSVRRSRITISRTMLLPSTRTSLCSDVQVSHPSTSQQPLIPIFLLLLTCPHLPSTTPLLYPLTDNNHRHLQYTCQQSNTQALYRILIQCSFPAISPSPIPTPNAFPSPSLRTRCISTASCSLTPTSTHLDCLVAPHRQATHSRPSAKAMAQIPGPSPPSIASRQVLAHSSACTLTHSYSHSLTRTHTNTTHTLSTHSLWYSLTHSYLVPSLILHIPMHPIVTDTSLPHSHHHQLPSVNASPRTSPCPTLGSPLRPITTAHSPSQPRPSAAPCT